MRGKHYWVAVGAATVVLSAGAWLWARRTQSPTRAQTAAAPQDTAREEVKADGSIRAQFVVDVAPPQPGIITAFFADPGQEVTEGQLLARVAEEGVDANEEQTRRAVENAQNRVQTIEASISAGRLEASRARAEATRSRGEYDRLDRASRRQQMLLSEGATPKIQAEKAQREFEAAQAEFQGLDAAARRAEDRVAELSKELDGAKRVLDDRNAQLEQVQAKHTSTEVLSPAEGMVIARKGEVGEPVGPEKRDFIQIAVNLTRLEVVLEPPPPDLALIKPGQPALVTVPGQAGEGILGNVKGIDHNQAIVEFSNPNPGIRPGMQAQVRIKVGAENTPPSIPPSPPAPPAPRSGGK